MAAVPLVIYAVDDGGGTAASLLSSLTPRPAIRHRLLPEGATTETCIELLNNEPFAILGIGFQGTDDAVHIARRARNAVAEPGVGLRPILEPGPRSLPVTFSLPALENMRYDEDAGVTTANFSLFTLLHAVKIGSHKTRCALIRLPRTIQPLTATGLVEDLLDLMEKREERAKQLR